MAKCGKIQRKECQGGSACTGLYQYKVFVSAAQPDKRPVQTYVTVYTDPQVKDIVFTATEDNVPDVVHRHAGVSNTSNFFKLQNKGYTVQLETPGYRITGMEQLYQTNRPVTNITDTSFHVDLSGNTAYASGPSYRVSLEEVPAAVTVQYDANGGVFDAGFAAGIEVERGHKSNCRFSSKAAYR